MGKYWDALAQSDNPAPGGKYAQALGLASGQKQQSISNKDLAYDPERSLGFLQQAKGSFASNDDEWTRSAAQSLYPNEPVDVATKRFGKTAEGRYYHRADDNKAYEVQPPRGLSRLSNIGSGVGPSLPAIAGLVGGIATAPAAATGAGAALTVGTAAGAAGLGEWLRQGIGDALLGDASTGTINKGSVATEAALSGIGQGIGVGMGNFASRYAAPDIGRFSQNAANDLYDKAQRVGIKLTPAEATGLQSQIAEQKRLKGVPEALNMMDDFYKTRNTDATAALDSFLGKISPAQDPGNLGVRALRASEGVVEQARKARTKAVDPYYKAAEKGIGPIDVTPVLQKIDASLATAKGSARTVLMDARKLLMRPGKKDELDTSFAGLDNAKKAIDAMLRRTAMGAEAAGIDRYSRGLLVGVADDLKKTIDTAALSSPAKTAYSAGRSIYKTQTENVVNPTKEALAPLLRIAPETSSVVRAGRAMLDPGARSPALIRTARLALQGKHPDVWGGLVRDFLQDETHKALQTMASGEAVNVAGKVGKALGDTRVMANIKEALSPGQFAAYKELVDVFQAAGRALDSNSDTAFKLAWEKIAQRRDMGAMAKAIEYVRPWDKAKAAQDFFAQRSYTKQAEAIAKIITSGDRAALQKLRSLKQYKDGDWRRWAILGEVLTRGGVMAADEALN